MNLTTRTTALLGLFLAALVSTLSAQNQTSVPITGEMEISYNTRLNADSEGVPTTGTFDKYTMSINIANSSMFRGVIEAQPYIAKTFGSNQQAELRYVVDCDVINPKNPTQTKNVGRIYGTVPIDDKNVYHFSDGTLKTTVFPLGKAAGFDSAFKGTAAGKPPQASEGMFAKIKKEALNVTKMVGGKKVTIPVTNYDRMDFQNLILAAGPVQIYPETTVSGSMLYDYGRTAWYFDNVLVTYIADGRQYQDRITGNIRWIEGPDRAVSGEGQYQFDVRINEPMQSEAAVFAAATDEAAFFETDTGIPALTGAMKYKDTIMREKVTNSKVTVQMTSNQLSKQQVMYLAKLLFLITTVPLNAE